MLKFFLTSIIVMNADTAVAAPSFDDLLSQLAQDDSATKVDEAEKDAAEARGRAAAQVYLPEISAQATRSKQRFDDDAQNRASVDIDLNLYRFGADRAEARAGRSAKDLSQKQFQVKKQGREYTAARLLLSFLNAVKRLTAESQFLGIREKNLELTKRLYSKGLKSAQDVSAVEIDLVIQKSSLVERQAAVEAAIAHIHKVSPAVASQLKAEGSSPPWPWTPQIQSKKAAIFLTAKPASTLKLTLAELKKHQAEADYAKIDAAGKPSLDLNWNNEWRKSFEDSQKYERNWTTSLRLSVPIYQRGINSADKAAALARISSAEDETVKASRALDSDFELYQQKLRRYADAVMSYSSTSAQAKQLYEHSLLGFQRGVISVNDLATDQIRFLDSEKAEIDGWYQTHLAVVDFCELIEMPLRNCLSSQ